jgi:hypothetical protein
LRIFNFNEELYAQNNIRNIGAEYLHADVYGLRFCGTDCSNNELYIDSGNDSCILGPSSQNGVLNVNPGSQFTSLQPNGGNYTLAQLKSGAAPGLDGDTPIAIWIGITTGNGGSLNTTISSISIH